MYPAYVPNHTAATRPCTESETRVGYERGLLTHVRACVQMVAGMLRHLRSLRTMERDNGWIYTLLEEAENERMHLMTFMEIRKATPALRGLVFIGQVSPCPRLVPVARDSSGRG